MIQLNILSGKKAGAQSAARRFPFCIGRAAENELQLVDDGVWHKHLTLEFNRQNGFTLATAPNALTTVNGEPVQTAVLKNGDIINVGSAKLQFWLAAASQRSLSPREAFVWMLLMAVTAAQFALIYWLVR